MTSSIRQQYKVERADLTRDREEILRLWSHLPSPYPDHKKLDWFYLQNPAGRSMAYVLRYVSENRLVGVILACPRQIMIDGSEYTAAVLGDFVVEPRHRSLGPGLLLQNTAVELTLEDFDLQYGFPNPASEKLRRYAGHNIDHQLRELVLPVDIGHYLGRIIPPRLGPIAAVPITFVKAKMARLNRWRSRRNYHLAPVDDEFIDGLWGELIKKNLNIGVRDSSFVNWRLRDNPFVEYKLIGIRHKDDSPAGYLACIRMTGTQTRVVDFVSTDVESLKALLAELVVMEQENNSQSIALTVYNENTSAIKIIRGAGFRRRGTKMAYIDLAPFLASKAVPVNVYLSMVDNDV